MEKPKKTNTLLIQISVIIVIIVLISVGFMYMNKNEKIKEVIIQPVNAQELFDMFECPCCGSPISANCCGMAKERQIYINGLVDTNLNKDSIINKYIKKYGLDSVLDEEVKNKYLADLKANAPADAPKITIEKNTNDLGGVSAKKGVVEIYFEFKNDGKSDLIINKLDTSCGCTSASVVINGQEGPKFNMEMHGENPTNYKGIIKPGQSALIKVYYDPNVHPDLTGPVTRFIKIFSNDPVNFETKITIKLNQIP